MPSAPLLGGLRVIPVLRAAHLDEIDARVPRRLLFFAKNYDMVDRAIPAHAQQVRLWEAMLAIARSPETTLELYEPLWFEYFPHWCVLAATWRLLRLGRQRDKGVVFFAIENSDHTRVLALGRSRLEPLARMIAPLVGWLVSILTERCAFGTDSSRAAYEQMLGPRIITSKTFPDLHAQRTTSAVPPDAPAVLFVGALEPRKGLAELMSAWEVVEQRLPNSELTIIGDGVMAKAVEAWVAAGEKRNWLGVQSRTAIYAAMQRSVALVVPSIRFGRWKEQVSRPIQEALSHGLTIVSSDETGIGSFLDTHGHYVIPVRDIGVRLADAIEQALRSPLPRQEVLDSLPMEDGRLAADRWLHSRSPSVCEPD